MLFAVLGNERMTQQVKSIGDVDSITMLLEEVRFQIMFQIFAVLLQQLDITILISTKSALI